MSLVLICGCCSRRDANPAALNTHDATPEIYDANDALAALTSPATTHAASARAMTVLVGDLPREDTELYLTGADDARLSPIRRQQLRCAFLRRHVEPGINFHRLLTEYPAVRGWFVDPMVHDAWGEGQTTLATPRPESWGVYRLQLPREADPMGVAPRAYVVLTRHIDKDELLRAIAKDELPSDLAVVLVAIAK